MIAVRCSELIRLSASSTDAVFGQQISPRPLVDREPHGCLRLSGRGWRQSRIRAQQHHDDRYRAFIGTWLILTLGLAFATVRLRPKIGGALLVGFGVGAVLVVIFGGMAMMA